MLGRQVGRRPGVSEVASPVAELAGRGGLRVRPQRPVRLLSGVLLVVAAVTAGLVVFTRVADRVEVLALSRTVLAGEQITAGDVRVVSLSTEDDLATVSAVDRDAVVGQYARVRLASGSLLVADAVQPRPLVTPGRVLMSVAVPAVQVPLGLREQSRVVLVVSLERPGGETPPVLVDAMVAGVPANLIELVGGVSSGATVVALSVEVPLEYVSVVGAAQSVSVAVLNPGEPDDVVPAEPDPATPVPSSDASPVSEPSVAAAPTPAPTTAAEAATTVAAPTTPPSAPATSAPAPPADAATTVAPTAPTTVAVPVVGAGG